VGLLRWCLTLFFFTSGRVLLGSRAVGHSASCCCHASRPADWAARGKRVSSCSHHTACDSSSVFRLPSQSRQYTVKASPATSSARPPASFFLIWTAKIGLVASPVPRFCPDLGLYPSGESRLSPTFRDALGDSGRNKCVRNGEETSRASCDPDLSAREIGRRPHRLVFRASSSSLHIVFRAL
jgi:hypothetical protein